MGKLNELQVDRTDAVDRPATGHKWMILKSEEAEATDVSTTARAALEALVKEEGLTLSTGTAEALKALAGELEMDGVEFLQADTEPEAEAEADVEASEEDAEDADEPEADAEAEAEGEDAEDVEASEDADEDVEKDADESDDEMVEVTLEDGTTANVAKSVLSQLIGEAILNVRGDEEEIDGEMGGAAVPLFRRAPRSKQPDAEETEVAKSGRRQKGDGLHTSWVFGQ